MLCDRCQSQEATIHFQQTRQGKTTEHHLCDGCAQNQGISQHMQDYFGSFWGGAIPGVFNNAGGIPEFGSLAHQEIVCTSCGETYQEFRKTGLFGCSHCYEAFSERLDPVFRRVQGNVRHHGHRWQPEAEKSTHSETATQLQQLRGELKEAVAVEDYERAAKLRDSIQALAANDGEKGEAT